VGREGDVSGADVTPPGYPVAGPHYRLVGVCRRCRQADRVIEYPDGSEWCGRCAAWVTEPAREVEP